MRFNSRVFSGSTYRLSLPIVDKCRTNKLNISYICIPDINPGFFVCRGDIRYIIIYRINIIIVCIP